ncbi:MAG: hypothetical protein U5R30_06570 [Deltaproteobacteria bacterium]|nr:hypothetical protein [Deltaproteobacteria bacterium]
MTADVLRLGVDLLTWDKLHLLHAGRHRNWRSAPVAGAKRRVVTELIKWGENPEHSEFTIPQLQL